MALKISLKRAAGLMLASAMMLNANPSLSKAAVPESASAPQSQSSTQRCKKVSQQRKSKKCVPAALAEPKAARLSGILPFVAITVIAAGVTVAGHNSKNCGKGSNSQNNGNCPASP